MRKNLLIAFSATLVLLGTVGDYSSLSRNEQRKSNPVIVGAARDGQSGNVAKTHSGASRRQVAQAGQSGNVAGSNSRT